MFNVAVSIPYVLFGAMWSHISDRIIFANVHGGGGDALRCLRAARGKRRAAGGGEEDGGVGADEEDVEEAYVAPRSPASGQEPSVDVTLPSRQPTTASSAERDATPSAMQRLLQPLLSPLQPLLSRRAES